MLPLLLSSAVVLLLDQGSKRAVSAGSGTSSVRWAPVRIRRGAHVKPIYGRRAGRVALVLLWLAALASALALVHAGAWFQSGAASLGLGLALGGAAGNLLDVLRRRHVVDFIDLGWWPVFNVADVGIVGGLGLAFWSHA
jgi:signal peptidase II